MPLENSHKITRIVIGGGGAKACAITGAYHALIDTGVMDYVEDIAGTSAGALSGSLIALGILPEELTSMLSDNFEEKLGKKIGGWVRNPEGVSYFTYDGKPLEKFIREELFKVLTAFFNSSEYEQSEYKLKLNDLRNKILNEKDELKRSFTFRDLALLHEFFPKKFKRLTVTAVNARNDDHALQIFNAIDTPDIDIARACRASGSIPTLFERVAIELNGKTETFVDGGLKEVLPVDYFDYDESGKFTSNKQKENTLILAFNGSDNDYVIDRIILNNLIDLDKIFNSVAEALKKDAYVVNKPVLPASDKKPNEGDEWFSFATATDESDEHSDPHMMNLLTRMIDHLQIELNQLWDHISHETDKRILAEIADHINENFLQLKKSKFKELEGLPFYLINEQATNQEKDEHIDILIKFFLNSLKSKFYSAGFMGDMYARLAITTFGDLHTQQSYSERIETRWREIQRQDYSKQIVPLQVGHLTAVSFQEARVQGSMLAIRAYHDVLGHLKNRRLPCDKFPHDELNAKSVVAFEYIYKAMLVGSGNDPIEDGLLQEINEIHANKSASPEEKNMTILELIKSRTASAMTSSPSVALSLALKYARAQIKSEDLFKATYIESFKNSGWFSLSNITGESIYFTSSLERKLDGLNFFSLYKKRQDEHRLTTRTDRIFDVLKQLESFNQEANEKLSQIACN